MSQLVKIELFGVDESAGQDESFGVYESVDFDESFVHCDKSADSH